MKRSRESKTPKAKRSTLTEFSGVAARESRRKPWLSWTEREDAARAELDGLAAQLESKDIKTRSLALGELLARGYVFPEGSVRDKVLLSLKKPFDIHAKVLIDARVAGFSKAWVGLKPLALAFGTAPVVEACMGAALALDRREALDFLALGGLSRAKRDDWPSDWSKKIWNALRQAVGAPEMWRSMADDPLLAKGFFSSKRWMLDAPMEACSTAQECGEHVAASRIAWGALALRFNDLAEGDVMKLTDLARSHPLNPEMWNNLSLQVSLSSTDASSMKQTMLALEKAGAPMIFDWRGSMEFEAKGISRKPAMVDSVNLIGKTATSHWAWTRLFARAWEYDAFKGEVVELLGSKAWAPQPMGLGWEALSCMLGAKDISEPACKLCKDWFDGAPYETSLCPDAELDQNVKSLPSRLFKMHASPAREAAIDAFASWAVKTGMLETLWGSPNRDAPGHESLMGWAKGNSRLLSLIEAQSLRSEIESGPQTRPATRL